MKTYNQLKLQHWLLLGHLHPFYYIKFILCIIIVIAITTQYQKNTIVQLQRTCASKLCIGCLTLYIQLECKALQMCASSLYAKFVI